MKKYFSLFIGGMLAVCGQAKESKTVNRQDNKSLLWSIKSKDMKKPSFLFGTIHMLCPEDYIWTDAMKKSLKASDQVCFEMDMNDPSVMMKVAMGMIDQTGKSLRDYFTEEEYALIDRFVTDSLGSNLSMFQQMKPAALLSLFSTKAVECEIPSSYEANIMAEAKTAHKDISGLEEPDEQLALFNNMPQDSVIKDLVSMAKDYSNERTEYRRLLEAYKQQDLPLLYELMEQSRKEGDNFDGFLDDRNKKWIDRMTDRMDQQSIFFAVGAGHLWGENGVINLLRKAGYTVEPVQ